jgi:hypothetical protein
MTSLQSGLNALQPSSSLEAATRGSWGAFVPEALYLNEVPGVRRGIRSDVLRRLANEACDQVVVGHFPTQHLALVTPTPGLFCQVEARTKTARTSPGGRGRMRSPFQTPLRRWPRHAHPVSPRPVLSRLVHDHLTNVEEHRSDQSSPPGRSNSPRLRTLSMRARRPQEAYGERLLAAALPGDCHGGHGEERGPRRSSSIASWRTASPLVEVLGHHVALLRPISLSPSTSHDVLPGCCHRRRYTQPLRQTSLPRVVRSRVRGTASVLTAPPLPWQDGVRPSENNPADCDSEDCRPDGWSEFSRSNTRHKESARWTV